MKKLISLVLPVYNESANLDTLYQKLAQMMSAHKRAYNFELIFTNDASQDKSLDKLIKLANQDSKIKVINLSRNFGHQIALKAGLDQASGDAVITLDSDLQDPPIICSRLIKQWEKGYDIVYARRRSRHSDSLFKKLTAKLFYVLIGKISDTPMLSNVGDFRLLDRKVVDEIAKFTEHNPYWRGVISFVGFNQTTVLFARARRQHGSTGYSLKKMWRLAIDAITGFSTVPLKLISWSGFTAIVLGFLAVILSFVYGSTYSWLWVIAAILIISGWQMSMLGIIGNYIIRINIETQNRPLYIVESVYQKTKTKRRTAKLHR